MPYAGGNAFEEIDGMGDAEKKVKPQFRWTAPITVVPWLVAAAVALVALWSIPAILDQETRLRGGSAIHFVSAEALRSCVSGKMSQASASSPTKPNEAAQLAVGALDACIALTKTPPQTYDDLVKARLDDLVKPRLDELKWMLTLIGSLAAFFVIAQSAAAWFTAAAYTKQATDAVADMASAQEKITKEAAEILSTIQSTQSEIESVQEGIKKRYPLFESVEQLRAKSFRDLQNFDYRDATYWRRNLYRELPLEARQQLLSVESFASIDLHAGDLTDKAHADLLVKCARFYCHRFEYENEIATGSVADLERAEGYLTLAFAKTRDFVAKNELGGLYTLHYEFLTKKRRFDDPGEQAAQNERRKLLLVTAKNHYRESLKIESNQRRAYYCLAAIDGRFRKKSYENSVKLLENCLRRSNWENEPRDEFNAVIYYNLAVNQAGALYKAFKNRDSSKETADSKLGRSDWDSIFESLKNAVAWGRKYPGTAPRETVISADFDVQANNEFGRLIGLSDEKAVGLIHEFRKSLLEISSMPVVDSSVLDSVGAEEEPS